MKRILFFFLPLLPYLATAQVAKDTVTVLTIADIPAGAIRDTTNFTFVQDNAFKKATFDSLAKYTRVKLVGDRGDITVSGATGLTWELDAGVVDSMQLSAGAVVLPGAKVVGTLPVNKGGTGSTTQNFVDLTSSQTIGGVKKYTSLLEAPRALYQSAVTGSNTIVWFDNLTTTTNESFGILIDAGTSENDYALRIRNATNSELMRVNGIGNLGIGIVTPTSNLEVAQSTKGPGTVSISNGSTTVTGANTQFTNTFKVGDAITVSGQSSRTITAISNNTSLTVNTAYSTDSTGIDTSYTLTGGTRFAVKGNGNVGIGTAAPAVQFHTTGAVRFATFAGGGTTTLSVNNAGDLLRTSSTVEYKKDIEPIRYGLKEVMALQPVNFNWIDEDRFGNINENGFIAEDVMNVLPNVANADGNGVFMDYTKLIAVLTKAIQEQQAQIEQLKQRITQLENK